MIGSRLSIKGDRVQVLRDYPNSWYFNGFDVSIIAGEVTILSTKLFTTNFQAFVFPTQKRVWMTNWLGQMLQVLLVR